MIIIAFTGILGKKHRKYFFLEVHGAMEQQRLSHTVGKHQLSSNTKQKAIQTRRFEQQTARAEPGDGHLRVPQPGSDTRAAGTAAAAHQERPVLKSSCARARPNARFDGSVPKNIRTRQRRPSCSSDIGEQGEADEQAPGSGVSDPRAACFCAEVLPFLLLILQIELCLAPHSPNNSLSQQS